jgi:hypothetical protein
MGETSGVAGRQGNGRWVILPIGAAILFSIVMIVMGILSSIPPKGPPIAVLDVRSGEPFEQQIVSRGKTVQVWLDVQCDDCSYPIEGNMRLVSDGRTLESVEIAAGSSKHGGWEGGTKSLKMQGVFDADSAPAGAAMILSGLLTVHGARDALFHGVRKDAPPPRVHLLRLTITE